MAKKPNGNGQAVLEKILAAIEKQTEETRGGFKSVADRFIAVENRFVSMEQQFAKVAVQLEHTNERITALAKSTEIGFVRLETRLEEIAKNTGEHNRRLDQRLRTVEERLGIDPPK